VATFVNAVNATLYDKLNFNFIRDIALVASIAREPFAIEVHPSVPVKTVPEFITHAKANPGKINMASAGAGSGNHVAGELFKMMTGVNLVHVPYRGIKAVQPSPAKSIAVGQTLDVAESWSILVPCGPGASSPVRATLPQHQG
jgi:tripartite-type tricarboxylate transporter receptor subunit TctC